MFATVGCNRIGSFVFLYLKMLSSLTIKIQIQGVRISAGIMKIDGDWRSFVMAIAPTHLEKYEFTKQ